jgi:transcription elongation factor GreA
MEDKFYLTKEGLEKIKQEHKDLLLLKQEKIHNETPVAFHSEELDTEFVSFKEDIEFLESKIADLEYILNNVEIIQEPPIESRDSVQLGAKILVDVNGKDDEFILIGTLEANPAEGKISNESPVGKAFLGRKVGDVILINSPVTVNFKIKKISY